MIAMDLRTEARAMAPSIATDDSLRADAIATWATRMKNEYQSSYVFDALSNQMAAHPFLCKYVDDVREFASEERRHGVLCGAVASALGGEAVTDVDDAPAFPDHPEVSLEEAIVRNVMSIGCLAETVAVALIGAEREEMPAGELRELLTQIWSDEIGHARFGWRLVAEVLPSMTDDARARTSAYLRVALRELERHELAHLPDSPGRGEAGKAIGLCSGRDARKLFYATVEQVILPRLNGLGLDATWAFRARHA
jgi:hypothetical protein